MNPKDRYIAVFDSGVGGISVLRELVRRMPEEHFLYYGDSAHAPYGTKPTQQVRELTLRAADHLYSQGIKALVVACNTATAAAIQDLRERFPQIPVVGIEPALKLAADEFPRGTVGIMATQVTLREEKLAHQMERFPELAIHRIPAPGLVELVEQGKGDSIESRQLLRKILTPYVGKLDALVLGCTHYPFAEPAIREILGDGVHLLDGSEGTARQTLHLLQEQGLTRQGSGSVTFQNSLQGQEILHLCQTLLNA